MHAILCTRPCVAAKSRATKPLCVAAKPRAASRVSACRGEAALRRVAALSTCRGKAVLRQKGGSGTASALLNFMTSVTEDTLLS